MLDNHPAEKEDPTETRRKKNITLAAWLALKPNY